MNEWPGTSSLEQKVLGRGTSHRTLINRPFLAPNQGFRINVAQVEAQTLNSRICCIGTQSRIDAPTASTDQVLQRRRGHSLSRP
jgi:hypothetical protein